MSLTLILTKEITATPERVFNAFTKPELLSKWFTTNAKVDLRVGGEYSNDDKDKGVFLESDPPHLLRFTWDNADHCPGTEVRIEISSDAAVTLTHSKLASEEHVKGMRSGWSWALDNVKLYLEDGRTEGYEEWLRRQTETQTADDRQRAHRQSSA